ncbi:hypothetical protein M406DRAFT_337854 [Cryphonectria parasitica EP155]|uniref:Uncharacterized protein n=1 Tax=Cryphonectria parasitica (strain ATCC 38755 / EP155) TaxID=660469 RepID=A0A9P5CRC4_CRYP1|nr:uncharacterized protein M406DRAFT_337854 [Cryphonectria parasitica EP155]KAF3766955.1 hypothetical protein M406DRAFT_337854 [Cryphonectria parasitica EP155]
MAIEAGVGLVLPSIPLRHKDDLVVYNQGNSTAERQFEEWFDQKHAVSSMGQTCPQLKVIAQEDLQAGDRDSMRRVENRWSLDVHSTRFFRERNGHFWAGKPFKAFFEEGLAQLREKKHSGKKHVKDKSMTIQKHLENEAETAEEASTTVTIVGMRADLELFNIANDPTGHDRHLWDDLGKALRFLEAPRAIVDRLLRQIGDERFFAVGFRGESNNMPESIKQQISENFDALDRAWESYRAMPEMAAYDSDKRPLVYLACGDEGQAQAFAEEGRGRGWNVTHKYALAEAMSNDGAVENISALPFDFEAIVDLGMLVKSYFFVGLMSSAFSYTVANMRDPTTRYRGSSFAMWEDGGARTHLLPNNDIHGETMMEKYACCL